MVEEDEAYKKNFDDGIDAKILQPIQSELEMCHPNVKRAAVTVLLTQKWRHKPKGKNRSTGPVQYQPTFKMKPDINLSIISTQILAKVDQTFQVLCSKHS